MQSLPVTIHRTWFGLFLIFLVGAGLITVLWAVLMEMLEARMLEPVVVFAIGVFAIVLVLLATLVQAYVYSLSRVIITDDGITVQNWLTLFASTDETFEWLRVSRATVRKSSIFAQLLGYGTLSIETNGGVNQVIAKWIPDVEKWQDLIQARADEATPSE